MEKETQEMGSEGVEGTDGNVSMQYFYSTKPTVQLCMSCQVSFRICTELIVQKQLQFAAADIFVSSVLPSSFRSVTKKGGPGRNQLKRNQLIKDVQKKQNHVGHLESTSLPGGREVTILDLAQLI